MFLLLPYELEYYSNFSDFRAHKWLEWAAAPCLLVVGTVGNLLSVWVLWRGSGRSSTFAYLLALGIVDQLALCNGLIPGWLRHAAGINLSLVSGLTCSAGHFLFAAASHLSVWLIVAVTAERAGMVQQNTARPASSSVPKARLLICCLAAGSVLANAHWLFLLGLYEHRWQGDNETNPICDIREPHQALGGHLAWLDSSLYCFLPFCIILACNCRIVHVLRTAAAAVGGGGGWKPTWGRQRRASRSSSSAVLTPAHSQLLELHQHLHLHPRHQQQQQPPHQQRQPPLQSYRRSSTPGFNRNFRQLTVTLLAISGLFLVTVLPITALKVATSLCNFVTIDGADLAFHSRYLLAQTCAQLLMYANHSANFFLYCLCGNKFRRELRARLGACGRLGLNCGCGGCGCGGRDGCRGGDGGCEQQ